MMAWDTMVTKRKENEREERTNQKLPHALRIVETSSQFFSLTDIVYSNLLNRQ